MKARQESLAQTEAEIKQEMAAALGRIGKTLAETIEELRLLRVLAQDLTGAERLALVEQHREVRKKAQLYFWYLLVQREAVGLRNHSEVRNHYSIPAAL